MLLPAGKITKVLLLSGLLGLVFSVVIILSEQKKQVEAIPLDFPALMERGKLVAVVQPNVINYFVYNADPLGFQLDLFRAFARHLNLTPVVLSARTMSEAYDWLQSGKADLIASDLLVSDSLDLPDVLHSRPILFTRHILIQRKPLRWSRLSPEQLEEQLIRHPAQLHGKRLYAPGWSVLVGSDRRLPGLDLKVQKLQGVAPERIVEMVSKGDMSYGVVSQHLTNLLTPLYPNLEMNTPLSDSLAVCWAVRSNSMQLLDTLNSWLDGFISSPDYWVIYWNYINNRQFYANVRHRDFTLISGRLSPYDQEIKMYSAHAGWDWRLVASLICQESRFDPTIRSRVGAFGLMQLMPDNMAQYGLDSTATPGQQIQAGLKYLRYLDKLFEDSVPSEEERVKFVLASYNIGPGHILDAQRLATRFSFDPAVWTGNVDSCLLLKSSPEVYSLPEVRNGYSRGRETFAFVQAVMERYAHYVNLLKK